jgi:hypothetical protein
MIELIEAKKKEETVQIIRAHIDIQEAAVADTIRKNQ